VSEVVFAFPGHEALARLLAARPGAVAGALVLRRFPDGETYVRLDAPVAGRDAVFVCGLHRPDEKLLPLAFSAGAARDLGAASVGIVAPYLGYLRQDKRFQAGEAISSVTFAKLLSGCADWLVTVDPHLHRYRSLEEIYSLRTAVAHAAPEISAWIRGHVEAALLVGPDAESEQWVAEVARRAGCPHIVLDKIRHGDREVEVSVPAIEHHRGRTPVLLDDIISTGGTMAEAVARLGRAGMRPPVCIGVHAVFADEVSAALLAAGASRIVSCNTIAHATNAIDVNVAIVEAVVRLRQGTEAGEPESPVRPARA
jgi:ribose-phosphate pyrophosphokinase